MITTVQGDRFTEKNGLLNFDKRLRERDFGNWTGKNYDDLVKHEERLGRENVIFKGGEQVSDVI